MSSGKEFVAAFKQQVGPAAEAYYKKVQGDYANTIKRADRLQRQIDALVIRKLAYSQKGKGSQNDAQNRLLSTLIRTQEKTGSKVKKWNEKAVNELRNTVKANDALYNKALNALKGSSGTFNLAARAETSDEFISRLDEVLKGAKIIPSAGEGKKVGFDAIFAYSIARKRINSDDRIDDQTKATITKQIDERAVKYFKQIKPELSEVIPNEIEPSALIVNYAPYGMSERDIQALGKDEDYIKMLAPSLGDKPEGEDHSQMIGVLKRKLGLDGSAEDIQIPGPSASLEDKQAFLSGALKTDGETVEFDDSQSPQVQEATRKLLSEQGVRLPISYTQYVQSAGVIASSLNPKKAEADYDREIQRLKDRQNRLYEVAARRGDVSKGQLASLMHPILPVAGFRDALNVSMPLEEMYPGLYMELSAAPSERDIAFEPAADQITSVLTDEELLGEVEEDDGLMPDRMAISPSGLRAGESPNNPGVPVMAAVVNRFKDASDPNNDIDPKDLIDDFNTLPDDLKSMFPTDFQLAMLEIYEDRGAKGSDPTLRKERMRNLMVQYGDQLDAISSEDQRRVSNYIATLNERDYPSVESNQVVELLNFLNHPGSLSKGDTVGQQGLQAQVLGSAGSRLVDAGFGNIDSADDESMIAPPTLPSILADARNSLVTQPRRDPAIASPESRMVSAGDDALDLENLPDDIQRELPGSPTGRSSAYFDIIQLATGKTFETAAVPEVTGTTTASAPAPTAPAGSRMAYTRSGAGDQPAIAVRKPPPDVDLGKKPEPPKTREELFRPGGAMSLDEYMAGETEEEPAAKPTMGDIAFEQSADQIEVDTDSKPAVNISPEALKAWDSKVESLASYAINQGGRNFGKVVQKLRDTAKSMGLPEDLSHQAEENIFYLTDVGQSDPGYQEYLARQKQEQASTKVAGGFKVPEEGDPNKKLDYGYTEQEAKDVLAEGADEELRRPYATRPTDPDTSGDLVITSMYGVRGGDMHEGIDLRARNLDQNTNVYTVMDGTVAKVDDDPSGGAGRYVFVNHEGGLQTRYFHGASIPERIQPGFKVQAGDMIMVAGQSGNSRGPHLHFEIGKIDEGKFASMDPMKALPDVFGQYVLDDDLLLQSSF